ncbi:catalase [uncultured Microbacterium sp.]|uniref:catalase n=1 Tax=uncultured Microbacterium sp. TaxID=191216 RepID=UPI0035CB74ED
MTRTGTVDRRADYPSADQGPVPVRIRHSKGGGALGFFETTADVSAFTSAALFQPGSRVDALVRFSATLGFRGSREAWRDLRGFAVKFFTADGEYDLVGNNSPVFFLRDEAKFASLVVAQKMYRDGAVFDYDRLWDFWTRNPESAHQVAWLLSDRGIPLSWRHQDGFGSHTFQWTNADGERFWVKYHLRSEQGTPHLTDDESDLILAPEVDHRRSDLRDAIDRGDRPSWTLSVQVIPYEDARTDAFNAFDLTKVWPKSQYPLIEVGRLVLDRNPDDEVGEIEQAAFAPSSFVPGIGPSPDPMLISRIDSYWRFHQHRVKDEFARRPAVPPSGPLESNWDEDFARRARVWKTTDDFTQAGELVRRVLDEDARERLRAIVAAQIAEITDPDLRERVVSYWTQIDAEEGAKIADAVR